MNQIPVLSEKDIRLRCGVQSLERGRGYFQNGALADTRRQGSTLRARCTGTAEAPYRVWVAFHSHGIASARCSCPIGHTGTCKHVSALLVNWLEQPEDFPPTEELHQSIERRAKGELVALLTHIFQRYPDLEDLLTLPVPGAESPPTIDPIAYRRQAATVFAEHGEDWTATSAIADGLQSLVDLADRFRDEGNLAAAAVVYREVAGEIIARFRQARYGEDALGEVVDRCLAGLVAGLAGSSTERGASLDALHAIYRANLTSGSSFNLGRGSVARILTER